MILISAASNQSKWLYTIEKCVRVKCRVGIAYGACLIRNQMDNTIKYYYVFRKN
jgi:hypothetical protein